MNTQTESRIESVIRNLRAAMPKRWPDIAQKSGVPVKTIEKIAYRETKDPRSSTLDALYEHFEEAMNPERRKTD
jgi:predicted transcriptional regulator